MMAVTDKYKIRASPLLVIRVSLLQSLKNIH